MRIGVIIHRQGQGGNNRRVNTNNITITNNHGIAARVDQVYVIDISSNVGHTAVGRPSESEHYALTVGRSRQVHQCRLEAGRVTCPGLAAGDRASEVDTNCTIITTSYK